MTEQVYRMTEQACRTAEQACLRAEQACLRAGQVNIIIQIILINRVLPRFWGVQEVFDAFSCIIWVTPPAFRNGINRKLQKATPIALERLSSTRYRVISYEVQGRLIRGMGSSYSGYGVVL